MFTRVFSKRNVHSRKPKSSRNKRGKGAPQKGKKGGMEVKPVVPTKMGHREIAELMMTKMPVPDDLTKMVNEIVYVKPFSEVNKDILRLIRRVSVVIKRQGEEDVIITPFQESLPAEVTGSEKEGVYLVMLLINTLLEFFEEEHVATQHVEATGKLYKEWVARSKLELSEEDEDLFTVPRLVDAIGGDKTRTALAVRCLNQNVAISGHTHIKSKVCPLMTKDIRGSSGWQVQITLADYVQVKHTRRECSIEPSRESKNHWEMQFDVHLTFDKNMNEITASKLSITDLHLSEAMDDDLADYLKEKFSNGKLVVC